MNVRRWASAGFGMAAIVTLGAWAVAGDLNPPSGSVAPTMKTLEKVEPRLEVNGANAPGDLTSRYRIASPGSYYLTGSMSGQAFKTTVFIDSSDVTLDLMGFRLTGATNSVAGVYVGTGHENVVIRNGIVTGFDTGYGVNSEVAGGNVRIEGITVSDCGSGMRVGPESTIEGCSVRNSDQMGFWVDDHSIVRECVSCENGSAGFAMGQGVVLVDCVAALNGNVGFLGGPGEGVIRRCTSRSNTGIGISVGVDACVTECTVLGNTGDGIVAASRGLIRSNIVRGNTGDGIEVSGYSLVVGNLVYSNSFHGIRAAGGRNTIDGNKVSFNNSDGIRLDSTFNVVVRNDVTGDFINNASPPNTVGVIDDLNNPWSNMKAD